MVNFSAASLTRIGLLLVLICWTTGSTGAAFSLEEELLQLKENYIQMREIVKSLEAKAPQQDSSLIPTSIRLEDALKSLEAKVTELESKNTQMQDKVINLEAKIQQQDSLLASLLHEKNERTAATDSDSSAPIRTNQSAVASNGLPSSCSDLKMIGHTLNGIYSVVGLTMMETIYCDFTKLPGDAGFQKWIGYADVKSAPTHFYVQRESPFSPTGTPITFEVEQTNVGNAMNLASGKFTAPRTGIYFFSFTGLPTLPNYSSSTVGFGVSLYLNGNRIGTGFVEEGNTAFLQESPLTLQSTLNMKSGDQVWLEIDARSVGYYLFDDIYHFNHFTGFMLEEEIVASL